ncbi:MAG: hypothetical protein QOJ57_355 [Thermoleophilaceae bacterium]|jgi:hypothetical protein|nr:hypothetical protein [Thermoleophilaceae bacterium]
MDWLGRGVAGLALMIAGVAGFAFCLYELIKTGTCASGGPYVSARPCPSSTAYYVVGLIAGIAAFLAGGAVFATRGRSATAPGLPPPKDDVTSNPPPLSGLY